MADYEKQKPQPQPLPQPNAAYYAPPVLAQPAYYAPPPPVAPRRNGPRYLFWFLLVIAVVVIALGAATLVLWLIFRPSSVKAYVATATLSRFELVPGTPGRGGGELLQYNLTVDIRVRNPNRFGIRYDYAEAQASYDDERFGFDPMQPFYLDSKTERTVTAAFDGSSPVGGDDDDVVRTYRREKAEGFYYVKVRLYSDLDFKVRVFRIRDYKSNITCMLRLPVPGNSNSPAVTSLGTKCDVDF